MPRWETDPYLEGLRAWGPWVTDAVLALQERVGAVHSIVPVSHDYQVTRTGILASVLVDHAAVSPVTVLAAGAHDRTVLVFVTATAGAVGNPRIDIGQPGNLTKFVADFGEGLWRVGAALAVLCAIAAGAPVLATIPSAGVSGQVRVNVIELPDRT